MERAAPIRLASLVALVAATAAPAFGGAEVVSGGDRPQVRFRYAPGGPARTVHVVGSFNGWQTDDVYALADPDGDGTWEATVTIAAGRHNYKFVVDGTQWRQDPDNPEAEADGHGGHNSVLDTAAAGSGEGGSPFGSTTRTREPSFRGTIYFLEPGTERLPDLAQREAEGEIFAPALDVSPRGFDEGFPGVTDRFEWFAIRYEGTFRAERKGVYRFRLLSDDGSRLYIDGRLVIDNDGLHGPRDVVQKVRLPEGDHEIVLDYMQGPALEVALQLFVTEPGSTSEEPVEPSTIAPRGGSRER